MGTVRKSKPHGFKWWKKKAWENFSKYVRLRDALATTGTKTTLLCFTCNKPYPAFGKGCAQAGHFIPGRGNSVLFDEIGVHGQCYNCNVNLKGNWVCYLKYATIKYGKKWVDELIAKKDRVVKYTVADMMGIAEKYDRLYKELEGK